MPGPQTGPDGRLRNGNNGPGPAGPAAPQPNGNGKPARQALTLVQQLESADFARALADSLPKSITAEKMTRTVLTAMRATPELAHCTPQSFFHCVLQCAQLGLEPNTWNGHAYLIPFRDTKNSVTNCTLIVGYQGMIELALRNDNVSKVWTRAVRQGDEFQVRYGLEEDIKHIPSDDPHRENMPLLYTYAVCKLKNGDKIFEVLSQPQIELRRPRSARKSPWDDNYEAMARKTAVRALFKWIPKSTEMALVDDLEERLEQGRAQRFASKVGTLVEGMGIAPIVDTEGEDQGSYAAQITGDPEPGANDAP